MWVLRKCHICAPSRAKTVACKCSVQHTCHTQESLSQSREDDGAVLGELANTSGDDIDNAAKGVSTELIAISRNGNSVNSQDEGIKPVEPAVGESYESPALLPDSVSNLESQLQECIDESTLEPEERIESHRGSAALKRPASPPLKHHFTCDICGKDYPTRPKLTWHRKIHGMTGEVVEWSAWR